MPGVKPRYAGAAAGGRAGAGAGAGGVWETPVTGPGAYPGPLRYDRCCSDLADVLCLQALRTLSDFEFDRIALGETTEALGLDCREVDEHIGTRLLRDKAKALRVVEPLHLTLCHTV